ncbi:MAG TPA: orotidine-5'-phosphate decarboxylase [Firmicutes bacterium]|nr:orotidine-5'-phosphate decarboxylase [Bacillota bacterium]
MKDKIIVALDVPTKEEALAIVEELGDAVGAYKIGMQLYNAVGPEILDEVAKRNGKVFLDLKFHDIPNTVASAARTVANLGVFMFNVHASGGYTMMAEAVKALKEESEQLGVEKPLLIAVTVLTSMSEEEMQKEVGVSRSIGEQVVALAKMAKEAGMDGVVASPLEIEMIREACGPDFLIVTPGIRPRDAALGDQKRVKTPGEAVRDGADYLVIGRPITKASDRMTAVKDIVSEIESLNM